MDLTPKRVLFSEKSNLGGIFHIVYSHLGSYATTPNINYFWNFGFLGALFLVIQLVTGIVLAMFYTPHIQYAFDSVDYIMRELNGGWLLRYMHANGASFFFLIIYFHIVRGMFYNSYASPRWRLWNVGVIIFFMMMATGFIGYVLPWGQMSLWGATVITNLFSAIPGVGTDLVIWIWGGFSVDNATLNRFFSLHYLLPFVIVVLVLVHIIFLHEEGSQSPSGVYVKNASFYMPFYPYFIMKDVATFFGVLIIYFLYVFYAPDALGHSDNYILADPLVTPPHIVPEWYFLPFYAILRSIPDKLLGVVAMVFAILVWLFLPILDLQKRLGNLRYRPLARVVFYMFLVDFLILGWVGQNVAESPYIEIGQIGTVFYMGYFLCLMPLLALIESHFHKVRRLFSKGVSVY